MSRITFSGWLKLELVRMSGRKTVSIHKLAVLSQEDNPRLAEPLLLFAMETGTVPRLMSHTKDQQTEEEYRQVLAVCGDRSITTLNGEQRDALPWGYKKLLESWQAAEERPQHIEESKRMRLDRSLQLMREKGVSNAQVYHALNLNPGNTNAYFKHGDTSKVSLENATKIMKYLYMA